MPPRKPKRQKVKATGHAEERWPQRAKKPAKNLDRMLTAVLNEQLRVGIRVWKGQAMLRLDAERLNLPEDLVAPLELPDDYGAWVARTVKPR